ncbi:MAG: zinc ribbon domain-containing protein [Gammaproteobacteria bacterium]|nr:zinc ribbon domain-containing protein [Gammaproteobacteria bacterium]
MPTYEYHCPSNDRLVTVVHKMAEDLHTWGELCARAGIDCGDTPVDASIAKRIGWTIIAKSDNLGCDAGPPIDMAPLIKGGFHAQ